MGLCRCVFSKIKYAGRDSDTGASIGVISQKRKKKFDVPRRDPLGTPGPPGEDPAWANWPSAWKKASAGAGAMRFSAELTQN